MNSVASDPPRWKDRAGQADLAERMAGRLIRDMGAPPPLSGPQLARIKAAAREKQRRPGLVRWWPAVVVALLVSGATFALAARLDLVPRWLRPAPAAPSAQSHEAHSTATRPSRTKAHVQAAPAPAIETLPEMQATAQPAAPAPAQVPARRAAPTAQLAFVQPSDAPRVLPSANRRRDPEAAARAVEWYREAAAGPAELNPLPPATPAERPIAPPQVEATPVAPARVPAPMPSAPVRPLSAQPAMTTSQPQPAVTSVARPPGGSRWLAEALHSLRTDHAPGAALALLDSHAAELTQSTLVHEAMVLRVEALLDLKRSGEALALLDRKSLSNVPASRTLLLTRAELRAAAGRCAESLADYDLLLARTRRPDEQALYGRGVCRSRLGDKSGAQADLDLYRREFPNGAHIGDVEKARSGPVRSAGPLP